MSGIQYCYGKEEIPEAKLTSLFERLRAQNIVEGNLIIKDSSMQVYFDLKEKKATVTALDESSSIKEIYGAAIQQKFAAPVKAAMDVLALSATTEKWETFHKFGLFDNSGQKASEAKVKKPRL